MGSADVPGSPATSYSLPCPVDIESCGICVVVAARSDVRLRGLMCPTKGALMTPNIGSYLAFVPAHTPSRHRVLAIVDRGDGAEADAVATFPDAPSAPV